MPETFFLVHLPDHEDDLQPANVEMSSDQALIESLVVETSAKSLVRSVQSVSIIAATALAASEACWFRRIACANGLAFNSHTRSAK